MREDRPRVRRRRLDARRSAVQGAVARAHRLPEKTDRSQVRRLRPLQIRRLAARKTHARRIGRARYIQERGSGGKARARKPIYNAQRLLPLARCDDDHLLVQGDRGIQRMRPHRRASRRQGAGRSLGRQYGTRLRQGMLREQHTPAAGGALRQSVGALVRKAAQSLRQAHRMRKGRRLLRRHKPQQYSSQIAYVLRRGRRQERRSPRRP